MRQNWILYDEFVWWLQRQGAYMPFLYNTTKAGNTPKAVFDRVAKARGSIQSVLTRAFDWSETSEGTDYWKEIQDRLIHDFMDRFPK